MKKIHVTKSYLPDIDEYTKYLKEIWKSGWLTNNGKLLKKLEVELKTYLGVKHIFVVSNGTIAIQLAIKALEIKKEVITTPFTYVATSNALLWEGCKPVFVDIDPHNFSIDPKRIEEAITKDTEAILAVHVYGYPSNVKAIKKIAKKHNLKVIYDAAHAFGTKIDGTSVLNFGDISTLSFHATKLFHMGEGGAIVTNNDALAEKIKLYRSFGNLNEEEYVSEGINAKNSEFHAALGLVNMKNITQILKKRQKLGKKYDELFREEKAIYRPLIQKKVLYNYAYYPVFFESEETLLIVKSRLEKNNIFPRRYFYPSLNTLAFMKSKRKCLISESYSKRVLCLPLYYDLSIEDVEKIAQIIKAEVSNHDKEKTETNQAFLTNMIDNALEVKGVRLSSILNTRFLRQRLLTRIIAK